MIDSDSLSERVKLFSNKADRTLETPISIPMHLTKVLRSEATDLWVLALFLSMRERRREDAFWMLCSLEEVSFEMLADLVVSPC